MIRWTIHFHMPHSNAFYKICKPREKKKLAKAESTHFLKKCAYFVRCEIYVIQVDVFYHWIKKTILLKNLSS